MSKTSLSLFALGTIALVLVGYFSLHKGKTSPLTSEEASILLYVEKGDVSYKNADMASFAKVTSSPIAIANNTQVYTGLGTATILFPNNSSVALDQYTELTVTYTENKVSLLQTLGTTYHRVETLITGASYEVETPGTLAAVRGTKFAVKYDKQTKVTKVAVTEHKVDVSKWKTGSGTTTKEILEKITLEEGKTARVRPSVVATTTSSFDVVQTEADTDMKVWVEENKNRDLIINEIKSDETTSKEEVREEIKKVITENKTETERSTEESKEEVKTEERKVETKPTPVETRSESTKPIVVVKKLDEEVFFDKFNNMFTLYFYLDENDSTCSLRITPEERARVVTAFGAESGYPFTSKTLAGFAVAIQNYCDKKDPSVKATLQARFDAEYPFQEDI